MIESFSSKRLMRASSDERSI
ncbi:MAG: hypothetical protein UZ07_CHB004003201, partial [Chlorobi bacterium OLB7]